MNFRFKFPFCVLFTDTLDITLSGRLKFRRLKTSSPLSVLPSVSSMIILLQWAPTPASVEFSNWNSEKIALTESDKTPSLIWFFVNASPCSLKSSKKLDIGDFQAFINTNIT